MRPHVPLLCKEGLGEVEASKREAFPLYRLTPIVRLYPT